MSEQDGGKYEAAVYAAQCSNLKRMLPICTNWEVCTLIDAKTVMLLTFLFQIFIYAIYLYCLLAFFTKTLRC